MSERGAARLARAREILDICLRRTRSGRGTADEGAGMSQSTSSDRISESTVARIAGNVASNHPVWRTDHFLGPDKYDSIARESVLLARAIVAEVQRTAPSSSTGRERKS